VSFNYFWPYLVYFIYFLASREFKQEKRESFKRGLIVSLLFSSLLLCFLSFYLLIFKKPPPFSNMNLIFANFGHNHVIDYLILTFPVSLMLFFKSQGLFKKTTFAAINLIFLATFIFSFSRAGIFIALAELILTYVYVAKTQRTDNKRHVMALALLAISLVGLIFILFVVQPEYWQKFSREISWQNRLDYWRQGILAIKDRPIFGWGLDNFRYLSYKYQSKPSFWSWYSHNHFLQIFVETGIVGGLVFLVLIAFVIYKSYRYIQNQIVHRSKIEGLGVDLALFIGLVASSVHSFFDYDWQFSSVFLIFWVTAGYLIIPNTKYKIPNTTNKKLQLGQILLLILGLVILVVATLEFAGNILLFKGITAADGSNPQKAEKLYLSSIAVWPFRPEKWRALANYYQDQKQKDKQLEVLNKIAQMEPLSDLNFKLLGDWYSEINDQKAKDYYWQAAALNPLGSLDIYLKLMDMEAVQKNKNWQEVYEILTKIELVKGKNCILKCLDPDNENKITELLLNLTDSTEFKELNKIQQAKIYYWLTVLTTSSQDWPQNITWMTKAVELDEQKQYKQLLEDLQNIQQIKDNYWQQNYAQIETLVPLIIVGGKHTSFHEQFILGDAYFYLGEAMAKKERLDRAEFYWKESKKINPRTDKAYLSLAEFYRKQNNPKEAKKVLAECVELNSWSQVCQEQLDQR
jgi:O-antigen ligase